MEAFKKDPLNLDFMPLGAILCIVELKECIRIIPVTTAMERDDGSNYPVMGILSRNEKAFGDYSVGRYMWMLANVKKLPMPIPWKGRQGLFEVPDEMFT